MKRFFDALHDQRRALALGFGGLTVLGFVAGLGLPSAILPEVTFPRIKVIADAGELPGEEMLRAATRPLEESIRRVPGVLQMRSVTSRGSTEINLDCAWGSDMDLALQRVQSQIDAIRATLPEGTTVDARVMNPVLFPVVGLSLTSDTRSLVELRDLAVTTLRPELARLPGVADVVIQGGRRLEARVTLDPAALEARGLDAQRVADLLREAAKVESVGLLDVNHELYLGLTDARAIDLDQLGATPIPVEGGLPVPLRELGKISLEVVPEFVRYAARDRQAVLVSVLRQPSGSTIQIADGTRRWFVQHPQALPPDVHLETFYDQSEIVRSSVASVRDSLVIGAALAIVVVIVALSSLRFGLAGATVLPGSIGLTLLGFVVTRQTLNMMTLGGIAAAVGLVLDDAIVVVEHLAHRRSTSGASEDPTSGAMAEILPSLVGSSLCTIAIFAPFMLLGGVTGAFFRVLALSMVLMLGASLVFCISALPVLVRTRRPSPRSPAKTSRLGRLLDLAPRRPWIAALAAIVLIGAIFPLKASLGSGFLPEMDEGSLILDYVLPPGTSLTESERILAKLEREIDAIPDIVSWSRRTGDQLGFFITEPNTGDYVLRLKNGRRAGAEEIADTLRERVEATLPGIEVEFGALIEDVIGDLTSNPQPIEVRIFGEDRRVLEEKAHAAAALIGDVRGVVDVKNGIVVSGPNLTIAPRPSAAALGLTAGDVGRAVTPAIGGLDGGSIVRGAYVWPIRVVTPSAAAATTVHELGSQPVPVASGRRVPLADVASLRVDPGEEEVERIDQRTMISVTARLSGRDLGSAVHEIQQRLGAGLPLPRGMAVAYGGLYEQQRSSFRGLAAVMAGAVAAVVLILLAAFRSWRHTGAVVCVVTASLAGVFAALRVFGSTFNISSFVGAIMVVGIVAENAYFLVAEHRRGLGQGLPPVDAARAAGRRRARPVLMTTAAGVAALAPLALGVSAGSAILRPLAQAVVGGFCTSAPLLLLVLPTFLGVLGRTE